MLHRDQGLTVSHSYCSNGNLGEVTCEDSGETKPGVKTALCLRTGANEHAHSIFCAGASHIGRVCPKLTPLVFLTCLEMFRDCRACISNLSLGPDAKKYL